MSSNTHKTAGDIVGTRLQRDAWAIKSGSGEAIDIYQLINNEVIKVHSQASKKDLQACYPPRIRQVSGTCYFNVVLNAFATGRLLSKIVKAALFSAVQALPANTRRIVLTEPLSLDECPKGLKWMDVLRVLYAMMCEQAPTHFRDSLFGFRGLQAIGYNLPSELVWASDAKQGIFLTTSRGDPHYSLQALLTGLGLSYATNDFHTTAQIVITTDRHVYQPPPEDAVRMGGRTFILDSCILENSEHVILGTFCGSEQVVYDSAGDKLYNKNWTTEPYIDIGYSTKFFRSIIIHVAVDSGIPTTTCSQFLQRN